MNEHVPGFVDFLLAIINHPKNADAKEGFIEVLREKPDELYEFFCEQIHAYTLQKTFETRKTVVVTNIPQIIADTKTELLKKIDSQTPS